MFHFGNSYYGYNPLNPYGNPYYGYNPYPYVLKGPPQPPPSHPPSHPPPQSKNDDGLTKKKKSNKKPKSKKDQKTKSPPPSPQPLKKNTNPPPPPPPPPTSKIIMGIFSHLGPYGKTTLTISPGKLGISLKIIQHPITKHPTGGAKVTQVDDTSMLHGQVKVGDVLITVDDTVVRTMEDVKCGIGRVRKLGIVKGANFDMESGGSGGNENGGNGGGLAVASAVSISTLTAATSAALSAISSSVASGASGTPPVGSTTSKCSKDQYSPLPPMRNAKHAKYTDDGLLHQQSDEDDGLLQVNQQSNQETTDNTTNTNNNNAENQINLAKRLCELDMAKRKYQKFPTLHDLNAMGDTPTAVRKRESLLMELLNYDRRYNRDTVYSQYGSKNNGGIRYVIVAVPLNQKSQKKSTAGEAKRANEKRTSSSSKRTNSEEQTNEEEADIGKEKTNEEREQTEKERRNNLAFTNENQYRGTMDKILTAWSSFCDGTEHDAASMILYYLAKRFPQCYVRNVTKNSPKEELIEMATKRRTRHGEKGTAATTTTATTTNNNGQTTTTTYKRKSRNKEMSLPSLDFVSHDGTCDVFWNTRYSELIRYKEEFGDCKVYTKSVLGEWVCNMRSGRVKGARCVTERRIELLDDIGFLWSGLKEGMAKANPRGQVRQHRAVAAKIVYPQLTIRECLYLGGYKDEELNVIPNEKHSWRTTYVVQKDQIVCKVKKYDLISQNKVSWLGIFDFIALLEGDDDDRYQKLFEECSDLLPQFLEAAEEREYRGIFEKPLRRSGKRTSGELGPAQSDEERSPPAKKRAHLEEAEELPEPTNIGTASDDDEEPQTQSKKRAYLEEMEEPPEPANLGTASDDDDDDERQPKAKKRAHFEVAEEPPEPANLGTALDDDDERHHKLRNEHILKSLRNRLNPPI